MTGDDFTQFFAPITGLLVDATSNEVNGNIAYLAEVPKSQFWTRIFELKSRGVIGVVSGAIYRKYLLNIKCNQKDTFWSLKVEKHATKVWIMPKK